MPLRAQHGSFRRLVDSEDWNAVVESNGNLTAPVTLYLYVQLVNRVGRNLLSVPRSVSAAAGDKIVVTFNESLVRPGEDVLAIILSASLTNEPTTAVQIAWLDYRLADQISTIALPATIELTEDAHVEVTDLTVDTAAHLPSGTDQLNGMVREITDEGKIYSYSGLEDSWLFHKFSTVGSYNSQTDLEEGADQLIGAVPLFLPPVKSSTADSVRVRYWLLNGFEENSAPVIRQGQSINFIISVNGETYSSVEGRSLWFNQVFDGLIKFELVGYYRYLNSSFDNSMDGAAVEVTWSPLSIPPSVLTLPVDLPSGWAAVIDVWLSFDEITLQNRGIKDTDVIGIEFDLPRKLSTPSPLVNAFGENIIFSEGDRALVLPDKIFSGKGIVDGRDVSIEEQDLEGIVADTDNQLVVVDSVNSNVRLVQPGEEIYNSESVRATISTSGGRTNPSSASNTVDLASGQSLEITITHPVIGNRGTVRGNYPDSLIAGSTLAFWDNPDLRLAIAHDNTLYEANYLITADTASSQTISLSSLDDFVEVPFLPSVSNDFGLFEPQAPSLAATGTAGTLPVGEYKAFFVYEYPAPNTSITKVSHEPDFLESITSTPALKTMPGNFQELAKPSLWSKDILATVADARALSGQDLLPWRVWQLGAKRIPYHYNPNNNSPDDAVSVIRPDAVATGALVPVPTLGLRVANALTIFNPHTLLKIGKGLSVTEDVAGDAIVVSLDSSAIAPVETVEPIYTSGGSVLQASNGEILR